MNVLWSLVPEFAPLGNMTPSLPADLKVNLVTDGGRYKINISWAINIDGRRGHFVSFPHGNLNHLMLVTI